MRRAAVLTALVVSGLALAPARGWAQGGDPEEPPETDATTEDAGDEDAGDGDAGDAGDPGDAGDDAGEDEAPPALPAPQLEEPGLPTEPGDGENDDDEERDGRTELLLHIGDRPPPDPPPTRGTVMGGPTDVPFAVPGDQRLSPGGMSAPPRPEDEPRQPPLFEIGATVGWSRLLADMALDYIYVEERFEMRLADLPDLRLGIAAAQHFRGNEGFIFEGGLRVGYGVYFFDDRDAMAEAVVWVQPGYAGGDVGHSFDLAAALEARLQLGGWLEISVQGGFSLIGNTPLTKLGGGLAITF